LSYFRFTDFWSRGGGRSRAGFVISTTRRFRFIARIVHVAPLFLGLASAYLFAAVPQMQEIYLGLIEDADWGRGLGGLAAVSLFSSFLYAWNHVEVSKRIDAIYPDHADIHFDRRVFDVRNLKTAFASSLPFFGLLIGLAVVYRRVIDATKAGLSDDALPKLASLPFDVTAAAAITLATGFVTVIMLHSGRKSVKRQDRWLALLYGFTAFLTAAPIVAPDATLTASRLAGPLASTAFVLLEAAVAIRLLLLVIGKILKAVLAAPSVILMILEWLPRSLRYGLAMLAPLLVIAAISASIIVDEPEGEGARPEPKATAGPDDIADKFRAWLGERKTGPRYPVFIVAAQGGGIYAASSAGAFLATMQDHCPAFARHIFAISAVSGGSVGAALFNAAFADSVARGTNRKAAVDVEPGCDKLFQEPGELSTRLRAITQEDHISPVLAYFLPDLLSPVLPDIRRKGRCDPSGSASLGRDRILEKSFLFSFRLSDPLQRRLDTSVCPNHPIENTMIKPFSKVWSEKEDAPALVLNATWVETGYRVAFSPFDLQPIGGGTLYSFANLKNNPTDPPLIEAAVASARFPGLMPPWTFRLEGNSRLTFVDGGYADSSGAATALQIYNKLQKVAGEDVDLYLIALTDKFKAVTPKDVRPVGLNTAPSLIYDFLSPVTTLLSVRDVQSRKAIKEAHTQLEDRMIVVQLDQKAFPLPLGWKLSNLSGDIIRLTIGDPGRCPSESAGGDSAQMIVDRNSCELKRIVDLLRPKVMPAQTLQPQIAAPTIMPAQTIQPQIAAPKVLGSWSLSPQ
jgi:hypothetical protein